MESNKIARLEAKLSRTKAQLATIGPMRPGKLMQLYRDKGDKTKNSWQLHYTYKHRSCTRYVRVEEIAALTPELDNFRRFRELFTQCIDISVEIADIKTKQYRLAHKKDHPCPGSRQPPVLGDAGFCRKGDGKVR